MRKTFQVGLAVAMRSPERLALGWHPWGPERGCTAAAVGARGRTRTCPRPPKAPPRAAQDQSRRRPTPAPPKHTPPPQVGLAAVPSRDELFRRIAPRVDPAELEQVCLREVGECADVMQLVVDVMARSFDALELDDRRKV